MTLRAIAALGLLCSLSACGGERDDRVKDAGPASVAHADSSRDTAGAEGANAVEPVFTPVELPSDFPDDFPIAPESTVVEATAREGSTGTWSTVTIVAQGEPGTVFGWYRDALEEAGWTVQMGPADPPSDVLHASKGDAYLDLATGPHPAHSAAGWVRTYAEIWKTHP
ncbi:MAG: hypothetical protein ACREMK_01995 [Gemmatimonadota bacterium]